MTDPNVAGAVTRGLTRTSYPSVQRSRTGVADRVILHDNASPAISRTINVTDIAM